MQFKVGQTVVYPHHGTASILEIKKRVIRGEEVTYLKLHVSDGDLMIEVPAEKIEAVGLRGVIDSDGARRVVEVLRENLVDEPTNWSRRYKSNLEKNSVWGYHEGNRGCKGSVATRKDPCSFRWRKTDAYPRARYFSCRVSACPSHKPGRCGGFA